MKNFKLFLPAILLVFSFSCNPALKVKTPETIVKEFFSLLNTFEIQKALELVSDNVHVTDADFELANSKSELYAILQWDSVFHPVSEIKELKISGDTMTITMSKDCKRISFLHNGPIEYIFEAVIEEGLITKMSTLEYTLFNFEIWGSNLDKLVKWTDENHPEWNGFQRNLSKEGAVMYSKAMELYLENQ